MSAPQSPIQPPESDPARTPSQATFAQVASAVFWSFFGVRKGRAMERDAVTIKPLQVIVIGVVLAAIFVITLLWIVRLILAHA